MKLLNLFVLLVIGLLCACSDDDKGYIDEIMDGTGAVDDTTNIAVTGLVDSYGVTYACLRGYANLNLMPMGSGEIGMEICLSDDEASLRQQTSSSLSGNTFVVEFQNLSPCTEYKYRSFVRYGGHTHYGQYRTFTTKNLSNVIVTGEVENIAYTSVIITSSLMLDSIDQKDELVVGMAYSTSSSFIIQSNESSKYSVSGRQNVNEVLEDTFTVTLDDLSEGTIYYYAAFTQTDGKYRFGDVKSFTTKELSVDLGLSVKWAACNVGANSPEESGGYYAWGEVEEKDDYDWDTYKWCNGSDDSMTKYCVDGEYGVIDNKTVLEPEDDIAHAMLGGNWRMPTSEDFEELVEKCTWEWTTNNDVNGQLVTGPNGNSIFLPAAGYRFGTSFFLQNKYGSYWSATLIKTHSCYGYEHSFDNDGVRYGNYESRKTGNTIRPVTE